MWDFLRNATAYVSVVCESADTARIIRNPKTRLNRAVVNKMRDMPISFIGVGGKSKGFAVIVADIQIAIVDKSADLGVYIYRLIAVNGEISTICDFTLGVFNDTFA